MHGMQIEGKHSIRFTLSRFFLHYTRTFGCSLIFYLVFIFISKTDQIIDGIKV